MKKSAQLFLKREFVDLMGPILPKLLTLSSPNNFQTNFSSKPLHVTLENVHFLKETGTGTVNDV